MSDLAGLIERLEKATGPHRILDGLVDIYAAKPRPAWAQDTGTLTADGDCVRISEHGAGWFPPAYTSSIDAALTLVPENLDWDVGYRDEGDPEKWFEASVGEKYAECKSTPAITLCIAALKARATERKRNDKP